MKIEEYLKTKADAINKYLDKLIPLSNTPESVLYQAARYSLLGGGKRVRPILAIATAESFHIPEESVIHAASALELVHTYSLIHDDLPCMDDDDLRRGQPTLHKVFPESHAVLAGDFLLTKAFEILATAPNLSDSKKVRLIELLAKNSGGEGMISGQILDIDSEGKNIDIHTLNHIHVNKTGALIAASLEFGGIIADATHLQQEVLSKFGLKIGLLFQIIDDILDICGSQELIGKTINSDLTNEKVTYVSLIGIENAKIKAQELLNEAKSLLLDLNFETTVLSQIADFIFSRQQ